MEDQRPDVSLSIPNRNGREYVRGLVQSIRNSTHRVWYEAIVVDNASTDGTREMLADEFPEVKIVANEAPRGYGASHNQGFVASTGRYFFAMNNDMIMRDGALDAMVERMDRGDNIGVLGCRLLNPDGSLQISCGRESSVLRMIADDLLPAVVPAERMGLREWMREWTHDTERDVEVVQGSCMMLPRELFDRAGRFDESFEFFREEFDLCRRVRVLGKRVVFFPGAEIVHFGGQTMKTVPLPTLKRFVDSRYRYFLKYWDRGTARAMAWSALVGIALRRAVWSMAGALRLRERDVARERAAFYASMMQWFFEPGRPWRSAGSLD